jgi:hypothetical protein
MAHVLIALVAMIGVVAMHGFTMNHDSAMASMGAGHTTSVMIHAGDSSHHAVMADAVRIGSPVTDLPAVVSSDGSATVAVQVSRASSAPSTHVMATACLAFLTGLLLLVGAGKLLARLRRGGHASALRRGVAWLATAVGALRPDLAELSVLRT